MVSGSPEAEPDTISQNSSEIDLFYKPYAQDDLISLRSEEEMTLPGGGSENDLLRPIFDAIDTERRGFITTDKFFEEMDRYSNSPMSAKKKEKLQKTLDPDRNGIVTYPNFVTGVLMFRLESGGGEGEGEPLSPDDDVTYDHLMSEWSIAASAASGADNNSLSHPGDDLSSGATNMSLNGNDSPDSSQLPADFEKTLTSGNNLENILIPLSRDSKSINASTNSNSRVHKQNSINDRFRRSELSGSGPENFDPFSSNGRAGRDVPEADEEVYSTYSDFENNDDALSVNSAHHPPYMNTNSHNDTDYPDDVALGRGGYPGFDLIDASSPSGSSARGLSSGPGPANIQSFRSMSEADRRKKEITNYRSSSATARGDPKNKRSTSRRTSVPVHELDPDHHHLLLPSNHYGYRRANSNLSNFSRSPRPQSPGGNSAVDDACSNLSESDAFMLDQKESVELVDFTMVNLLPSEQRLDGDCEEHTHFRENFPALEGEIRALQQQLENYVSGRAESEATQQRLREDKNMLQNRTMMLEEQVGELKRSHEEEMARLKQAHREEKQQLERDCREKLEQSRQQMRELEQSGHQYKLEVPRLSGQLELLKEDKQRLEDKIESRDSTISQYELRMAKLEEEKDRMQEAHERKLLALQNEQRQLLQDLESRVGHSRPNSRQSFRNTSRHLGGSLSVLTDSHDEYGGAANFSEVLQKCNQLTHENLKLQDKIHELESNYRVLESRKSAFCDNCHQLISNGGCISVDSSSEKDGAPRGHGVMAGSSDSLDMLAYDPDAAAANSPLPTCSRTPPQHQNSSVANQLANTGQTNLGASQPSGLSLAAELAQVFNKPREINMNEVVKDALANNKSYETICLELKQQEQINSDLQNYLSRLLLLIMESYPEILEVK